MPTRDEIEAAFLERRTMLWGLCYRLTGVAADADELVQETFVRVLERPPPVDDEWKRWLVRVATNLSIDRLRARRRRAYVGPWLPAPIETPCTSMETDAVAESAESGYERLESVSYAFLLALEALTPRARAALILCDVLEYSAAEVALLLDTTEANIRVLHHRARRRLADVRPDPRPLRELEQPTRRALEALIECLARQDAKGVEALLVSSARTVTDGGGRYTALREPLVGAARVTRFHLETFRRRALISTTEMRSINGLPALVITTRPTRPQMSPAVVLRCEVERDGRIRELHAILAPGKLSAIRFGEPPSGDAGSTLRSSS